MITDVHHTSKSEEDNMINNQYIETQGYILNLNQLIWSSKRKGSLKAKIGHIALSEVALIRPIRICKNGLQLAIFDIQAHQGCSKDEGCSARQNTSGNYFVGPKMTPPDPVLTLKG